MFILKLKKQLHVGTLNPIEKVKSPLKNHVMCKAIGGLFTSTFLGNDLGSDWIQWCVLNEFGLPENDIWNGYLIDINKDANIFVVNTVADMHYLFDTYSYELVEGSKIEQINFIKMSEDYDGVHITKQGEMVTRHPYLFDRRENIGLRSMYGWDCESTHFFRNVFDNVEEISLEIKKGEDDEF